jgi:hypothetical protein
MSDSRDLIRAIMDEDFVAAKELTNSLLFSTVADNIDDVRAEVGQSIYGDGEVNEKNLVGNQSKIDMNKNGKLDAQDFKILRSKGKKG